MDIQQIMSSLPPTVARKVQLRLEDTAVSTHLLPEEAREIVQALVDRLLLEYSSPDEQRLLKLIPDAIVKRLFG